MEGEDLAAPLALGHAERPIRLAHQIGLVEGIGRKRRHADADRQPLGAGVLVPRQQVPLEPLDDALRQGLRPFRGPFQQDDAEFVPAEARHRVDLPHGAVQDAGEFLQGDVAGGVREPFVEFREAVDVEHQQAERSAVAAAAEDLFFELMVEVLAIVKVRQRIEERVEREGFPESARCRWVSAWSESAQRSFTCTGVKGCETRLPKTMTPAMSRSLRMGKATRDREDHASQMGSDHPPHSGSMETALPKCAAIAPGAIRNGEPVRGRGGLDASAEADLPCRRIAFLAGEEPARFDSRDLLGDVEQGVEDGIDFERGTKEVAAFQEGVDRRRKESRSRRELYRAENLWCSEEVPSCRTMSY